MPGSKNSMFSPRTTMILAWMTAIVAFTIGGILFSQGKKGDGCLQKFVPIFMMFVGSAVSIYAIAKTYEYFKTVKCGDKVIPGVKSYMSDEKMNSMINSFMNSSMSSDKSYMSDDNMSQMVDSFMNSDTTLNSVLSTGSMGGESMMSGKSGMKSGMKSSKSGMDTKSMVDSFMKSGMSESGMCGYAPSGMSMSGDASSVYF